MQEKIYWGGKSRQKFDIFCENRYNQRRALSYWMSKEMNWSSVCTTFDTYRSDFLFGKISFFDSISSIFRPFKSWVKINYSISEEEADARALNCDFWMVGKDLVNAMNTFNSGRNHNGEE